MGEGIRSLDMFYYYLLLTTAYVVYHGGMRYARVRTPTATIFYSGRDGGGLYFYYCKNAFFAPSIGKR